VELRRHDRSTPRCDETFRRGVTGKTEEREAVLGQSHERLAGRNDGSRSCLRRGRRSYDEQRQDGPESAHVRNISRGVPLVYIGLGSNLGDREATIRRALELLAAQGDIEVEAVSSLRDTDPVGYEDQPRFLNGAAALRTRLSAQALLRRLQAVERELGRDRSGPRFGPRTIDLDLLLYGKEVIDAAGLVVPHPRLTERRFVLEPLLDLDDSLEVPGHGSIRALLAGLE
jgi:2-amino-4-hydroxy-6-hydroxymethyldihydropteridine diphosphokinase